MSRKLFQYGIVTLCLTVQSHAWAQPAQQPQPRLTVVNVSSHCDWSWGHTRLWHEQRYAEIIRQVLLLMREHPHYRWLLENETEELAPFMEKAAREWPEMIPEFWQRVREGRIEVISGMSNPRLTEVYPETMVRNLVLGREYFSRHAPGMTQKVYNAIDLMCGPSQMPQILAQAGFRYFMFSRPIGPQVVFWRKGLDGTRMLSSRCFYGYDAMGKYGEPVKGFVPSPIWRLAIGGDDVLPDPKLPREAVSWDPQSKILGTNSGFFEEVERAGTTLTELQGPLDSLECYVEAGIHGDRNLYMQNNRDEDLLLCLEKAQVITVAAGGEPERGPLDALWRDVLSCAGHAIMWAWKADYDERLAFARHRRLRIEQALAETLSAVTARIGFRSGMGAPLTVFNFHPWPVTGPVELGIDGDAARLVLRDDGGKEVPVQSTGPTEIAFIAENVPPCGYKTFYLSRAPKSAAGHATFRQGAGPVENGRFRAAMKPDGTLEIFDTARRILLGSKEPGGLGEIVYYDAPPPQNWQMNGPLGPMHRLTPGAGATRFVQGPVFAALHSSATFGSHSAARELRLWRGGRRLDYRVDIEAAEGCGVFAVRFPVGMTGRVSAGIPFGAEPRENFSREPFREEFFVKGYPTGYYATRWTDVSSDSSGYTFVCPPGANTGYAYDPDRQALEFLLLRVRPLTAGVWGQMHPSIKGTGRHAFAFALVPHAGTWREAATPRDVMEFHVPLLAFSPGMGLRRVRPGDAPPKPAGNLEHRASFAEISPAGVMLSAMRLVKPAEGGDRNEIELRMYEATGREADTTIRLGAPVHSVRATDFLGRPGDAQGMIEVRGGGIHTHIRPWQILNLRVRLAGGAAKHLNP